MIIRIKKQNNFSDSEEKEMRWIDEHNISKYKRNKKLRDIRKDQYSEDSEIRKKANRKELKRYLIGSGSAIIGGTALGTGLAYGATKLPKSTKNKLGLRKDDFTKEEFKDVFGKNILPKAITMTGIGTVASAITNKRRNKRVKERNLNSRDKRIIDRIKVADGEMSREEFIEKWGK